MNEQTSEDIRELMLTFRNEIIELCALSIEKAWHKTPNENTGSVLTSYLQNEYGPGCRFAAETVRKLKEEQQEK